MAREFRATGVDTVPADEAVSYTPVQLAREVPALPRVDRDVHRAPGNRIRRVDRHVPGHGGISGFLGTPQIRLLRAATPVYLRDGLHTAALLLVAMKCRCLETRLSALSLMKRLGATRENLWELVPMFASAKRLIEIEHGATLTDEGRLSGEPACPGLPPDEIRIRDVTNEPQPVVQTVNGAQVVGRLGGFFMRAVDGRIYVRSEFLPQPSWISESPGGISDPAAISSTD